MRLEIWRRVWGNAWSSHIDALIQRQRRVTERIGWCLGSGACARYCGDTAWKKTEEKNSNNSWRSHNIHVWKMWHNVVLKFFFFFLLLLLLLDVYLKEIIHGSTLQGRPTYQICTEVIKSFVVCKMSFSHIKIICIQFNQHILYPICISVCIRVCIIADKHTRDAWMTQKRSKRAPALLHYAYNSKGFSRRLIW